MSEYIFQHQYSHMVNYKLQFQEWTQENVWRYWLPMKIILLHQMWFTKKFLEMCNNMYLLLDFKCFLLFLLLTYYKFNMNDNINIFMNSESRHSIRYWEMLATHLLTHTFQHTLFDWLKLTWDPPNLYGTHVIWWDSCEF